MGIVKADKAPDSSTVVDDQVDEQDDGSRVIHGDEAGPESEGVVPNYLVGQRVKVVAGEYAGRMGYVLRVEYADDAAFLQANTAGHPKRAFAKVESYIIRTRDARTDTFSVTPEEIRPLETTEGWGRGEV